MDNSGSYPDKSQEAGRYFIEFIEPRYSYPYIYPDRNPYPDRRLGGFIL